MDSTLTISSVQAIDAEGLRDALRCGRPRCACQRGKQVHCPAHEDNHPSCSIDDGDGRLLVHCFAGCTQETVIEALRARDLWNGLPLAPRLSRSVRREGKAVLEGPLVDVLRFVDQYVVLSSDHARVAAALWVAHCWTFAAFDITPYLLVKSAVKRSGKTQLLKVLALLLPRPWHVFGPSEAVLFRKIAQDCPQVLLDETDPLFNGRLEHHEPLRAILNAGFERGAVVPRCVGEGSKIQLVTFEVFCAKAIATIGKVPDTIEDRSIIIPMKRTTPAEQRSLKGLRRREAREAAVPIREALARWAERVLPRLRDARPTIPSALDARAADLWEPLLAVAEEAGNGWAVVAWEAALALSAGDAREDDSAGMKLLGDVARVFGETGGDRIFTSDLLRMLKDDEEAPWRTWGRDKDGLTPHGLARLLKPFGIRSGTIRVDEDTAKGYYLEAFADTFARLFPPLDASDPSQPSQPLIDAGIGPISDPSQTPLVTDVKNIETPHLERLVTGVTDLTPPGEGGNGNGETSLAHVGRRLRVRRALLGWRVASPPEGVRAVRAAVTRAGLKPQPITFADVVRVLGPVDVVEG